MTTTTEKTQELKQKQKNTTPRPIELARDTLKTLSEEVKDLVEDGTFPTINEAIMETLYKQGNHKTFNTYMGWQKRGKKVKKGEKAFLLWGRPKDQHGNPVTEDEQTQNKQEEETTEQDPTEETYKFFPIVYLFSNEQVEDIVAEEQEENITTEPQEQPQLEPLPYE
jgi:bisphosphoglycerate-dependent phosphoglycerate mutase